MSLSTQIDPYYRAGTATFDGSATVTGQGTAWLANVMPGDQIFNYVGQMAVVASVNSDTSITLTEPFAGTHQGPYKYTVYRVPDSARVDSYLTRMVNLLTGGNLTSLGNLNGAGGDKMPYFNGAGSMALTDLPLSARELLRGLGRLGIVAKNITDWHAVTENGWYIGDNAANAPAPGWFTALVTVNSPDFIVIEGSDFVTAGPGDTKSYRKHKRDKIWGEWDRVYKTATELDARYVNQAGDTMSGGLGLGGSLILGAGGSYVSGVIYADATWGMIFRALYQNPTGAHFSWRTGFDIELLNAALDGQFWSVIPGFNGLFLDIPCRAWGNYNPSNGLLRASRGISSIVYQAVGRYRVNFSTAMPDANYSVTTTNDLQKGGAYGYDTAGFYLWTDDNGPTTLSFAVHR
jgi:hypothetical protein